MRRPFAKIFFFILLSSIPQIVAGQECSTEKVNDDCTITIDRSYPVATPTIQMRPGKTANVRVLNPLPFEVLSLDIQSGQALAGTDQVAGFLNAALPNLKGLLFQQQITGLVAPAPNPNLTTLQQIQDLQTELDIDVASAQAFTNKAATVYNQLNEAIGPLPPQILPNGPRPQTSNVQPSSFPRPWVSSEFGAWQSLMLCEMVGDCATPLPGGPDPCAGDAKVLLCGSYLVTKLSSCSLDKPDDKLVACRVLGLESNLLPAERQNYASQLAKLDSTVALLTTASGAIANIDKDLAVYAFNIKNATVITPSSPIGLITDPRGNQRNAQLPTFFGRQVVLSLNALNEISAPSTSVTTAAQKKSIVSITVVFANPKFEVSTGVIISTLPNRSFANQTIVTQNPNGSSPTLGNVVITQSKSIPTVVLFAGGNYRIGHDFLWPDKRRGAFYLTGTVGLNVNNTNAEFGVGPSLSWRSVMFSILYDWGHDVRLTQGEFVGMIWCNQSAASPDGKIPKCSGNPPSPSTEKYWKGAVAFGIAVRIPTLFNGGGSSAH